MTDTPNSANFFHEGCSVSFSHPVTERDINLFAELSGDFSPNHVDEAFMKKSAFGKRIAHGALLVAYMSRASSMIIDEYPQENMGSTPVSLGYDRIRFIKPVFIDDTVTLSYEVEKYDPNEARSSAGITIKNQHNELVAVATHILKWVPDTHGK
jgi:3-hydroxybutyryl-CoA dehydratase